MIKYYCDICGKEVNKTPNDFQHIIVPTMYNGIVHNSEESYHMCNQCANDWYNCFCRFCNYTRKINLKE